MSSSRSSCRSPSPSASLAIVDSASYPPFSRNCSSRSENSSMFSVVGSFDICARALLSASSSTSRPRPDRTWEKPLGSSPSPWATGTWGRYP